MKVPRSRVLTGTARRVARHGWLWLRDPDGRREERAASSLAVFIIFFPLIVGAFGFGIDIAKNIWIRSSIQNAVDTSAVGGAGVTQTDPGTGFPHINGPLAIDQMRNLYKLNRDDNPGLTCTGSGNSSSGCYTESWAVSWDKTEFNVHEQSRNSFLWFLGPNLRTQHYSLQGKAKISLATQ